MPYLTVLIALLFASLSESLSLEHLRYLGWQRNMRPRQQCLAKCQREQCPDARLPQSCLQGQTWDMCGCCWDCGNREAQICDPEPRTWSKFCGQCADGVCCKATHRDPTTKADPKPVCVCTNQEILCGTDGKTYENICQLRAVQCRLGEQKKVMVAHQGVCRGNECLSSLFRLLAKSKNLLSVQMQCGSLCWNTDTIALVIVLKADFTKSSSNLLVICKGSITYSKLK